VRHQRRIVSTANAAGMLVFMGTVLANRDQPAVRADVIYPVRDGLAQLLVDEVEHIHPLGLTLRPPGAAPVRVGADQLLLLGVHADHRLACSQVRGDLPADVTELAILVRVLLPLDGLGIALQAVTQAVFQQPFSSRATL
jgi:hypothetical protein